MAIYKKVAENIKQKINTGEYVEKLPTEDDLLKEFEVSRNTIRSAVNMLVDQAILYRVQGSGVYIREIEREDAINLSLIKSVPNSFNHHKIETKVLNHELIEADQDLANQFKVPVGSPVYQFERLRVKDGKPFLLEYCYYNKKVIPYLGREILEASVFEYIEKDLNKKIGFADRYITAEKVNKEEAELLEVSIGDPALVNNEKIFLANGELFSISRVLHHYLLTEMYVSAIND
ncbi:GntR family transcriptional regulator [Vagococcus fluvialis]|uniref:GntR family transcriptional regulator n=1 Tax=Vagococcus fluvialis TaxID=2738 RepID=UPI003B2201CE